MMKLNHRYGRNLRHSLSFYLSATILTALGVVFLISMYSGFFAIDTGFAEIMEAENVEDAQFTTLKPITEGQLPELETTFNLDLEEIRYVDIKEEAFTVRVFAEAKKINTLALLEGNGLTAAEEVLLNGDFALANGFSPGDRLSIGGKTYRIAGIAVRPDYLYAQKDSTDFYLDDAAFGQVTMSQAAFDQLENPQSYYAVVYHEDNSVLFRKYLYDTYYSISYLPAAMNNRIALVTDIGEQYGIIVVLLVPLIFGMIALIVAIVLGRKIKKEKKQIGTLVAFGYRKWELIRHYAIYALIPGLLGSIVGILMSLFLVKPMVFLFAADFETINFDIRIHPPAVFLALLIPTVMYLLAAVVALWRLLRQNTILLLAGADQGEGKNRRPLIRSNLSFRQKFRLRNLIANKSRTLVVVMGLFLGGFLCIFGFVMVDSCNELIKTSLDAAGRYEYQYVFNNVRTELPKGGEPMLTAVFEAKGKADLITLSGLVEDPKNLWLETKSGAGVKYGKYYMTSNAAALFGVSPGGAFTFVNLLTAEEYTVRVEDIIQDNTQSALYTSSAEAAKLLGLPVGSYNVILSEAALDLDKAEIAMERTKSEIKAQLDFGISLMMKMIYMFVPLGVLICMISVYLTVNMLMEENRHNISMLKVLGYKNQEINRLVLSVYHSLLPISFILCLLATVKLAGLMFQSFISEFNIYIEPVITPLSMAICFMILASAYFVALSLLKRKAYKIDMVASLKDNRE